MSEQRGESFRRLETVEPSPGLSHRPPVQAEAGRPIGPAGDSVLRRMLSTAAATVVAAAGLVAAFLAFGGEGVVPRQGDLVVYRDPTGAWEITYPDRFTQGTFPQPSRSLRVTIDGIWIANFDSPRFDEKTGGPRPHDFPDNGVMVEVYQMAGGEAFIPTEPDSPFPISLDELKVIPGVYRGSWRADTLLANGEPYTFQVRVGPGATQEDREAVAKSLSSFRILPLQEGTAIGRHLTFYVLGPPDAYPVGSVTLFDMSSLPTSDSGKPVPFYLVRAPEGFYALSWPQDLQLGYKHCDVTYDPTTREFSCPNGARWGLDGSVISKPGPGFPDDPLQVLLVRISHDDYVLVSPTWSVPDTQLDLQLTGG